MGSVSDNTPLTDKQEAFCQTYHQLNNQYQTYLEIYPQAKKWKRNSVDVAATKLMSLSKISLRIAQLKNRTALQASLTVTGQLKKLSDISDFDPGDLFNPEGTLLAPHKLPEAARKAIASFEAKELPFQQQIGGARYRFKYKFWSKPQSIDMENKHLGFYEADNQQKAAQIQVLNLVLEGLPKEVRESITANIMAKLGQVGEIPRDSPISAIEHKVAGK